MKKILILIYLAPVILLAQQRVPNFPVDSASGLIRYQQKFDFPGVDRKKIFDLMLKWLSSDGRGKNKGTIANDTDSKTLLAIVMDFTSNQDVQYELGLTVTDEHATVYITGFEIITTAGTEPLEKFRDNFIRTNPHEQAAKISLPGMSSKGSEQLNQKLANRDSELLDDIDQTANAILRDARRYVKKAQKKQLL